MRPFGVFQAMVRARSIEVTSGRLEVRPLAAGGLMEVDRMLSRRKALEGEMQPDPLLGRPDSHVPNTFSSSVLELHHFLARLFGPASPTGHGYSESNTQAHLSVHHFSFH